MTAKAHLARMCHGQQCYLRIPGVCRNDPATVVPAHSNQLKHGKGRGIKADDFYTVPACYWCHMELDQGKHLTKWERRTMWDAAFDAWLLVREMLIGNPDKREISV